MPVIRRRLLFIALGTAAAVGLTVATALFLSLPSRVPAGTPPAIAAEEHAAVVRQLKPPRERPLIAIIGINDATEVTDYLMPHGILTRADVADVMALSTAEGSVKLYPALRVQPQATVAEFDIRHPAGADYVIVPAMSRDDDPAVVRWLKSQAAKGAMIIGVCAGAKVVASTGLLDGKRATTHWYYVDQLRSEHPDIRYVPNQRFVIDGRMVTTTGITATIPVSLTLIEAIAGEQKARSVARDIGIDNWDARHNSGAFRMTRSFVGTVLLNSAAFWRREELGIPLTPGMDQVSLALTADAWSRTYRSRAVTFAATPAPLRTKSGLHVFPDEVHADWPAETRLRSMSLPPAHALEAALEGIGGRYGAATANLVTMQLELPRRIR